MPRHLIDQNVRIDYTKLRHLLVVGRQLNGNFDLLRHVAGEERAEVELQPSFPLERLEAATEVGWRRSTGARWRYSASERVTNRTCAASLPSACFRP